MPIIPQPGYIIDPNNSNGVVRDPNANLNAFGTSVTPTGTPVSTSTVITTPPASSNSSVITPEDQKLLNLGLTPDQLKQINTPEGLDPTSFQNLIGNVEDKLKTNNDLVTTRGYLIKHLYDSPLTPDQISKLPDDIKRVVQSGDKDTIELQLRLLNDQIAGRGNTLSKSISYLADSYKTNLDNAEKEKQDAIGNVKDFVSQYGSKAPQVLSSLYGPTYLAKLKNMGIDINAMANVSTLAEDKASLDAKNNKLLTPAEAKVLQVPYGTTVGEASALGVTPSDLSASTKTMVEAAPNVKMFVNKLTQEVTDAQNGLGPMASRWREFKAGKIGLDDPAFTQIRTNMGLLTTLLMRMHVGARGGEYIMKHFQDLVDAGKQSPENLLAALGEISDYADAVIAEGKTGGSSSGSIDSQVNTVFDSLFKTYGGQ